MIDSPNTPLKYLDKALGVLRNLGLIKSAPEEAPVIALIERIAHYDEDKAAAIARTLAQASLFNEVVREQISAMNIGERYETITKAFDSIRDDAKRMVEQVEDGDIDTFERLSNVWMKVTRGDIPSRFEKIKRTYLDVAKSSRDQIDREQTILTAYQDFRVALKEAQILGLQLLKIADERLGAAKRELEVAASALASDTSGDNEARARLEMARDLKLKALQDEDKRYQIVKDLAENLSIAYGTTEVVMARLSQITDCKERVYSQAVTFFGTNETVFTALSASFTGLHGLHESTQTLESMKEGINKSLETLGEVGSEIQEAALKAGYGPTIRAESVKKLVDAVVGFQERSYLIIEEMRDLSTKNESELAAAVEDGKRRFTALQTGAATLPEPTRRVRAETTTPPAPGDSAKETTHVPLDEVMLAMDVVDTLRHQRAQVEAELDEDQREQRLVDRIKSIYESQGMDVPSEVIAEGVRALVEDRFTYEPPRRGFAVRLAEVYVDRGAWAIRLLLAVLVAAAIWAAFAIPAHFVRQGLIEDFRTDVSRVVRQADDLEQRAIRLDEKVSAAHSPSESPAAVQILADARRNLSSARGDVERLLSELEPGPDPESYPTDRDRLDGVLTDYRSVLERVNGRLGAVDGLLESVGSLRDVRGQAERALVRLEGIPIPDEEHRDLEASRAAVLAAASAGRIEEARTGLQGLKVRVAGLVRSHAERQSRVEELGRLSARMADVPIDASTRAELVGLQASVQRAIDSHDDATATRDLSSLASLVSLLDLSYELRIVTGGQQSGVWRKPPPRLRSNARNYYIVVEAIDPGGRRLSLRIKNEETGRTERVSSFGIRVPEEVYESVKKDKTDNGIIENKLFGVKRRGARAPDYSFPVVGGMITRW